MLISKIAPLNAGTAGVRLERLKRMTAGFAADNSGSGLGNGIVAVTNAGLASVPPGGSGIPGAPWFISTAAHSVRRFCMTATFAELLQTGSKQWLLAV